MSDQVTFKIAGTGLVSNLEIGVPTAVFAAANIDGENYMTIIAKFAGKLLTLDEQHANNNLAVAKEDEKGNMDAVTDNHASDTIDPWSNVTTTGADWSLDNDNRDSEDDTITQHMYTPSESTSSGRGSRNVVQIFVKNLQGKPLTFEMPRKFRIAWLKRRIQEREGIPRGLIRLIYAGKQVEDNRTLDDYDIPKEAMLHMVLRLVGS